MQRKLKGCSTTNGLPGLLSPIPLPKRLLICPWGLTGSSVHGYDSTALSDVQSMPATGFIAYLLVGGHFTN